MQKRKECRTSQNDLTKFDLKNDHIIFCFTFLLWKLRTQGRHHHEQSTLSNLDNSSVKRTCSNWLVCVRSEDGGWRHMEGWSGSDSENNEWSCCFIPQDANNQCDECNVKWKERGEHATCAFNVRGSYPFGFLQTGVKGSFTCLRVNVCVCVHVCVVVFSGCKCQVCRRGVTVLVVQEEQCCFRGNVCFLDYSNWLSVRVCMCMCVCVLWFVCPECDSAVSGGWEEGQVLCVPSTLNHLVAVLSHHGLRQLLGQVT